MFLLDYKDYKNKKFQEFLKKYSYDEKDFLTISDYDDPIFLSNLESDIQAFGLSNPVLRKIYLFLEFNLNVYEFKDRDFENLFLKKNEFRTKDYIERFKKIKLSEKQIYKIKKKYEKENILSKDILELNKVFQILVSNSIDKLNTELYIKTCNFKNINKKSLNEINSIYYDFLRDYPIEEQLKIVNFCKKYCKKFKFLFQDNFKKLPSNVQKILSKKYGDRSEWFYHTLKRTSSYYNLNITNFHINMFNNPNMIEELNSSLLLHKFIDFAKKKNPSILINERYTYKLIRKIGDLFINKEISLLCFINLISRISTIKITHTFKYYTDINKFDDKFSFIFANKNESLNIFEFIDKYVNEDDKFLIINYIIKNDMEDGLSFKSDLINIIKKYDKEYISDNLNLLYKLHKDILNDLIEDDLISFKDILIKQPYNIDQTNYNLFFVNNLFIDYSIINNSSIDTDSTILEIYHNKRKKELLFSEKELDFYQKLKDKFTNRGNNFFTDTDNYNLNLMPQAYNLNSYNNKNYPFNYYLKKIKGTNNKKIFFENIQRSTILNITVLLNILKVASLFKDENYQRYFLSYTTFILENSGKMNLISNKKIQFAFDFFGEKKIYNFLKNDKNLYLSTFIHRMEQFSEKLQTVELFFESNPENELLLRKKLKKTLKGYDIEKIHTEFYKFYDDLFHHKTNFKYDLNISLCTIQYRLEYFLPQNSEELRIFGRYMNNCIKGYTEDILNRKSTIVCIKKNNKPFANCELVKSNLKGNKYFIKEMKLKNNKIPNQEDFNQIVEGLKLINLIS